MRNKIIPTFLLLIACFFLHGHSNAQAGQVKANGINIAYESFGSKDDETILLISGTNAQLTMYSPEFCNKLVSHGYRVVRFDNRDIGLSTKFDEAGAPDWAAISNALMQKTKPPLAYTLDDMADDAVGLLDAIGIRKAHIVGASMGGMIAQRVAYNHPEHTLSLVSIMSGGGAATFPLVAKPDEIAKIPQPADLKDTAAYIQREIKSMQILSGPIFTPDLAKLESYIKEDVKRSYYPEGLLRQGAASLAGFYAGRQEKLKTIKVPTVVIHGDQDPLVAMEAGKDVAANIPGATFKILKGMGHYFPEQVIDTLVDLIVQNAAKAKQE